VGAFEFAALDERGTTRKGVQEGDTARQVRQALRDQGWTPLAVEPVEEQSGRPSKRHLFGGGRGISSADLSLLTRQLATLIRAALPLEEALRTIADQTEKARVRRMVLAVHSRVLEGHSLSASMDAFPRVFPDLYRATVEAGEQSGHLDVVLERLADYTESRQALNQRVQLALLYPVILVVVALFVVGVLLTYVVPEVIQVFEHVGQELPLLTRILITTSDFLQQQGLLLLIAGGGLLLFLNRLIKNTGPRRIFHKILLKTPLVRKLVRGLNAARFARTLSILSSSGVPFLNSLRIAAEVMNNLPMREAVLEASDRVREGAGIRTALARSGYFPPMTLNLIASGEASGNLDEMLLRAAENQEREVETLVAVVLGLFEPLLILVMGGLVAFIVAAILLPIIELNQLVR
jgi:general secretion pathway protein F